MYNCRNGELISNQIIHHRFQQLCDELSRGYQAIGMSELANSIYQDASKVVNSTSQNYSSTLQDIQRNSLTEIDYINGYFCELMGSIDFNCEHNQKLWEQIRALEEKLGCT